MSCYDVVVVASLHGIPENDDNNNVDGDKVTKLTQVCVKRKYNVYV